MSKNKSPAIIVTNEFNLASTGKSWTGFLDYTNRLNASQENNSNIVTTESNQNFINEINEILNDTNMLSFDNYLSYTNRSNATTSENNLTAVFNEESNNMTNDEIDLLKRKIAVAEENNNILWKTVISFDTNFLIENGILIEDKKLEEHIKNAGTKKEIAKFAKQRQIDQVTLKNAVRNQMDSLKQSEGLSSSTFFWGNVHLNTEHVHVHIGMSELQSNRPFYDKKKNERKGKFKIKSLNNFKSQIHNSILSEEKKEFIRTKQINVATIRKSLIENFSSSDKFTHDEMKQIELLNKIYVNLPEDKKGWRYKSNAKNFQTSKKYLKEYVDTYLEKEHKDELDILKKDLYEQAKTYENSYSTTYDKDSFVDSRIEVIRERIGNKLLKELKENPPKKNNYTKDEKSLDEYKKFSTVELEDSIQMLENKLKNVSNVEKVKTLTELEKIQKQQEERILKQEIGITKYELKQKNLKLKEKELLVEKKFLADIRSENVHEDVFLNFKMKEVNDSLEYVKLQQKPNRILTPKEQQRKKELSILNTSASKIKIDILTEPVFKMKREQLKTEYEATKNLPDPYKFNFYFRDDRQDDISRTDLEITLEFYQDEIKRLDTKKEIHDNNQRIKNTTDEKIIYQLKQKNMDLFDYLNNKDTDNQNYTSTSNYQRNIKESVNDRYNQSKGSSSTTKKGFFSFGRNSLNKISKALSSDNKKEMRALMNKIRLDEAEERELERERSISR